MECSKSFTIEVADGVEWQNLLWGAITFLDTNGGSSEFSPENTESSTWSASATAPTTIDIGRLTIDGTLTYAGPNRNCQAVMQIATNGVPTEVGTTQVTMSYFLNSILQTSAQASDTSGPLVMPFTAQAGNIVLRFGIRSSLPSGSVNQPKPMVISCTGVLSNV